MIKKVAFIFTESNADPSSHNNEVITSSIRLSVFAVANYEMACQLANKLIEQGFVAIELCGGFGAEGVARITQETKGKIPIGVVRFDYNPLLQQSGDALFNASPRTHTN